MTSGAIHGAHSNIEDRDFNDALEDLTDANFSGLEETQKPEIAFLRAKALYGLSRSAEAKAVLAFIIENYSDSKYPPQARALLAKWEKQKAKELESNNSI